MSVRRVFLSRRNPLARQKRTSLKFIPSLQDLEDRKLLSGTPPTAVDSNVAMTHDKSVSNSLFAYEGDADIVTFSVVGGPSHGTLTLVNNWGSFTYTPNPGYVGHDSFTFNASDKDGTGNTATVSINVMNSAPTATDVTILLYLSDPGGEAGTGYTPPLKSSDVTIRAAAPGLRVGVDDSDLDPTTIYVMSNPSHGQVTVNSDGSVEFAPDEGFTGVDSFTFVVSDGIATSRTATATILVAGAAPEPAGAMTIFGALYVPPYQPIPPLAAIRAGLD